MARRSKELAEIVVSGAFWREIWEEVERGLVRKNGRWKMGEKILLRRKSTPSNTRSAGAVQFYSMYCA